MSGPSTVTAIFVGLEKFLGNLLQVFAGDRFDRGLQLLHAEKAAEIHLLARQVRHARARRFEREQQRAFQMIFGAAQFFFGYRLVLHPAELLGHRAQHALDGVARPVPA